MPTPRLTDELAKEAADAFKAHGRKYLAAKALGLTDSTFDSRLKVAAERGMMLDTPAAMPGFRVARVTDGPHGKSVEQRPEAGEPFTVPDGHRIKGVSALLDPDGRELIKWVKTTTNGGPAIEDVVAWIKGALGEMPERPATPAPATPAVDFLTLVPLADWHIGMFGWHREVGENWDLKIAENTIGAAIDDLIARSPSSDECVVLGGGDLLHSDNNENKTSKSGNVLQVDGRYQKTVDTACRLVERAVARALERHRHVTLRILPGNHDEHACVAVAYAMRGLYRAEPRVTVDTDPSLFWWHRFGDVMLGATHGHTVKIKDMPQIMATRRAPDWGATRHRYVHGFHLHHTAQTKTEGGGCVTEIHQAPIPQDAWHFGSGFLSGRSVQAITYHRQFGEVGRVRTAILDGGREAA